METATVSTSFRTDRQKLQQLDVLAGAMGRSRSWVMNEALDRFLAYQEWFLSEVQKGIAAADRGEFAPPDEVDAVFSQYGVPKAINE